MIFPLFSNQLKTNHQYLKYAKLLFIEKSAIKRLLVQQYLHWICLVLEAYSILQISTMKTDRQQHATIKPMHHLCN